MCPYKQIHMTQKTAMYSAMAEYIHTCVQLIKLYMHILYNNNSCIMRHTFIVHVQQ